MKTYSVGKPEQGLLSHSEHTRPDRQNLSVRPLVGSGSVRKRRVGEAHTPFSPYFLLPHEEAILDLGKLATPGDPGCSI